MKPSATSILLVFGLLASHQTTWADPIPVLTATSASAAIGVAEGCTSSAPGCRFVFSATGDSFTLSGSGFSGSSFRGPVGPGVAPTFFGVSAGPGILPPSEASGQIVLAGTTYSVDYSGLATVNAPAIFIDSAPPFSTFTLSAGDITAPPITPDSPETSIVLPATMQGSFSACAVPLFAVQCVPSSPTVANVSIDLSGELTFHISVAYIGTVADFADTSESFVSTPVPEPADMPLIALGVAFPLVIILQHKPRKRTY